MPSPLTANGGYLEGLYQGTLLFEWDANGAGLDLDLSDMMGLNRRALHQRRRLYDVVRLLSLDDSLFAFSATLDDATAIGDPNCCGLHIYRYGTYTFDRFTAIGYPDLRHINAVQIEIVKTGGVAGLINAVSFAPTPTPVPDGGSTIVLLSIGLVIVALWRTTTLS